MKIRNNKWQKQLWNLNYGIIRQGFGSMTTELIEIGKNETRNENDY